MEPVHGIDNYMRVEKILPGITIKVYMSKFLFLLIQYMTFFLVFLELAEGLK